ncbi:MFS transporter [Streptomyces sp. NPDC020412]|uniref:MFS transporter n=1 Tax=Streptomyces sp. NPDC020412 TaxID=3365073 RepID=UPI0037B28593
MTIHADRTTDPASPGGAVPPAGRPTERRGWLVVWALVLVLVMNYADKIITNIAGPAIMKDLGIGEARFGVVQASFFALFAVGGIVGGWLMTRVRPWILLLVIMVIWSLSLLPMGWQVGFGTLVAMRVVLGFAEGPTTALAMYIAHTWFPPEKRALPSSVVIAGANVGAVIGAPTLTWIVTDHSWNAAFVALAVAGLVVAGIWLAVGREGNQGSAGAHAAGNVLPDRVPLRAALTTASVIGISVMFFAAYASTALKISWLKPYLEQGLGYEARTAGNLTALPYLGGMVAVIAIGFVSAALTRRGVSSRMSRGVLGASLVIGAGVLHLAWAPLDAGPLHMALLVLSACMGSAGYGATFAAISDVAPLKQRGVVLAAVTAVYGVGGFLAPLVLGGIVENAATKAAGYTTGFTLVGVVLIVGGLVGMLMINPERDAAKLAAIAAAEAPASPSAPADGVPGKE